MQSNKTEHFAACIIEGVDRPLAILIVSFDSVNDRHNCDEVRENIRHIAMELSVMFELEKRTAEQQKSDSLF
jgi:hypothetical protein